MTEKMLPELNENGDLPVGIHPVTWEELGQRFGTGSDARVRALAKLKLLHQLAERTGELVRFVVFGSFVSAEPHPRDVDVVLVMAADFKLEPLLQSVWVDAGQSGLGFDSPHGDFLI